MTRTIYDFEPYLYTRNELESLGVSKKKQTELLNQRVLVRILRGIYAYQETLNHLATWENCYFQLIAHYKSQPQTIYSHHSAAIFHRLALLRTAKIKIHVYRRRDSRASGRGLVVHPRDICREILDVAPNGARITNLVTTVIDCARVMKYDEALVLAESALAQKKIPLAVLQDHMLAYQGHVFRKVHRVALALSDLSESPGETLVSMLLDNLGIAYEQQKRIVLEGKAYRADFYLPDFDVYIEFDGRIKYANYGSTEQVLIAERQREKAFLNSGASIFRTDWNDVFVNPHAFKAKLLHYLGETRGSVRS